MDYTTIKFEMQENVAVITLNSPEKMNALTNPMIEDLLHALDVIVKEGKARAAVITGEGRAFCAGGELAEIGSSYGGPAGFQRHMEIVTELITAIAELPMPVIAAVNGAAVGAGANIALAADFCIASEKAKFSEVFTNLGIVTDCGGSYFLPRLVGTQRAKEIIFSGRMLKADELLELGLALKVIPADTLMEEVMTMAKTYAEGPTFAYAMAKKLVNSSFSVDLKTALDNEAYAQAICGNTKDFKEGVAALIEKRKPKFSGE